VDKTQPHYTGKVMLLEEKISTLEGSLRRAKEDAAHFQERCEVAETVVKCGECTFRVDGCDRDLLTCADFAKVLKYEKLQGRVRK